jgi:hypothetical protein
VDRLPVPRPWVGRIALAVGVVVVIALLVMAANPGAAGRAALVLSQTPEGVLPSDAEKILGISHWRLARSEDYDPAALAWMRHNEVAVESRVEGEFCDGATGTAYFLMSDDDKRRRLVVLCHGENVYDTTFPAIGMLVRIPRGLTSTINWLSLPPVPPDGDLLLFTRGPDLTSGLAVFVHDRRIFSGVPASYQSIRMKEYR